MAGDLPLCRVAREGMIVSGPLRVAAVISQGAIPTPALVIVGEVVTVGEEFTTLATVALPTGVCG